MVVRAGWACFSDPRCFPLARRIAATYPLPPIDVEIGSRGNWASIWRQDAATFPPFPYSHIAGAVAAAMYPVARMLPMDRHFGL